MSQSTTSQSASQPIPLLDLKAQYAPIREEIRAAIDHVADSQMFILGPEVEALEHEVAAYSQCQFGIGMSSGTDALLATMMAIGVRPGDEVITTPYTFFATAGCIARLRAKAVFADIDPLTFNMDPAGIKAAITPRTKAIIPVHLFGQVADMDPIMAIAERHNLVVIEDAAQAIGSEYKGRRAGSIGHLGCFSFFPSKNLGGFGDGGMATTNDPALADKLKWFRNHGMNPKYYHRYVGGNFRLDALQAAVLRVKLKYLDGWTAGRQRNAARYRRLFAEAGLVADEGLAISHQPSAISYQPSAISYQPSAISHQLSAISHQPSAIGLPHDAGYGRHIYNQFVIRTDRRATVIARLKEHQIGHEIYYPVPLHLQECFAGWGYRPGGFPHSEQAAAETLALPIYPELTEEMQARVVAAIAEAYA